MIPPSDPRLLMQIAIFVDDNLKEAGLKIELSYQKLCTILWQNMAV